MKSRLEDLAIFGGSPAFHEQLHVGRPNIGNRERLLERINDLLDRRWLTNDGPNVVEFEQRVADMVGVRHCIAVCNATVALDITIRAMGLAGEVIVPSFTFIATAHALEWQQVAPVFCDIDPNTHTIDPARVERLIRPRTTGIIGVHLWGRACDVGALTKIVKRHNLKLLFDAAHALGCSHHGQMIGSFGDAEVFSFHATKVLNTFEGGAVTTNDDELAAKIRLMRNFGFSGYDEIVSIGTNGKMSEAAAAMGLTSLESMDAFIAANYRNYKQYQKEIIEVPGVRLLDYDEAEKSNYHFIVLEIEEEQAGLSRDQMQQILWAENVLARRYFYPGCHNTEPYRSRSSNLCLPHSEGLARRVLSLPTGTAVSADDITQICQVLCLAVANARAVSRKLSRQSFKKTLDEAQPGDS